MKKFYCTIILLIAFCKVGNSQNDSLERSVCDGIDNLYTCVLGEDNARFFYLGYLTSDVNAYTLNPYITKLDNMGATVWKKQPFNGAWESGSINQVIYDSDSNLVYSGYKGVCDVPMGNGYVEKISKTDGTTLWLKTFDIYNYYYFGSTIIQRNDSCYLVSSNNQLYTLNALGDSINAQAYSTGVIQHITATPDSCYLLNCDSGLIKINSSGDSLYSIATTKPVNHVAITDSNFYFFESDNIIYRLDSALNIIAQINLDTTASQINAVVNKDNQLWVIMHLQSNNISSLLKLDYNFGFIDQHDFNYFNGADLDVRDILVNDSDYDLIIHEELEHGRTVLLKSWTKDSNLTNSYNSDIGVSALMVDSNYATLTQLGSLTIVYPYAKISLLVNNYGTHLADSFFVNAVIPNAAPMCFTPSYSIKIDTILQPGDSAWVNIGWVSCGLYLTTENPTNQIDYCFYTSSPDGLMDYNHSNDNACITFNITNFVGIDEIQNDDDVSINPNPASSQLTIRSNTILNASLIKIFDVLGNLALEKNELFSSTFNVDINNLHPGLYFISINTEGKSWVRKFLKM